MKDIEDLKRKWQNIELSGPDIEHAGQERNAEEQPYSGRKRKHTGMEPPLSIKQRMITRLKRLYFAVVAGILFMPTLYHEFHTPLWFMICWVLYFALASVFNYIQIRSLHNFDFASMTTVESISFIRNFTRRKIRFRLTMIPLGAGLLIVLTTLLYNDNDPYIFTGIGLGAVLGLIIGLSVHNRFNADLRLLKKYLGED